MKNIFLTSFLLIPLTACCPCERPIEVNASAETLKLKKDEVLAISYPDLPKNAEIEYVDKIYTDYVLNVNGKEFPVDLCWLDHLKKASFCFQDYEKTIHREPFPHAFEGLCSHLQADAFVRGEFKALSPDRKEGKNNVWTLVVDPERGNSYNNSTSDFIITKITCRTFARLERGRSEEIDNQETEN